MNDQTDNAMSLINNAATPKAMMGELVAITDEVKKHPAPVEPKVTMSPKELLESGEAPEDLFSVMLAGVASIIMMGTVPMAVFDLGPLALITLTVGGAGIVLAANHDTEGAGKFRTRLLRKKHYLKLHNAHKEEQALELEAYTLAAKKHEKVMKRLRKRAQPIIDQFSNINPDKELVFNENGFDIREKYDAEQRKLIDIGMHLVPTSAEQPKELDAADAA